MPLPPAIGPRETERAAIELLNAFLGSYFNGVEHQSPLGNVTFENCLLLFNQTEIDDPTSDRSQIHTVISDLAPEETWFAGGNLSAWEQGVLASPASGVAYGRTVAGQVEESVHGRLVRSLPGTDIRWQVSGSDLLEQTFVDPGWVTQRTFTGADSIRWQRAGADYKEQVRIASTWSDVRTISPANALWDGTKKLVTSPATLSIYVRAVNSGDTGEAVDHRVRKVAAHLVELLQRDDAHLALGPRGLRRFRIMNGPTPLASTGYQTRLLVATTTLRYFVPKQL